ncbi:uncharacterized protein LACBIDRAFT_317790 [Laccaria bicolor S238N-H82]|uniref:Predicted protein n=1 Tax=Laccaria bicolor (strain S238N-H82 / ATCC MYA-4686) TaxID=486041 RepID=B0E2C8_LACBS|nr:uncharacterized protein LACBIDRAFT_317790 [Laccaria bicolor S238N-H82]EDQ99006.1 predicted protein [Laccaria bicolor S238N-H82]|eukprot:XP_001890343.1 predicted protein [Laccaria bicolor S238N-H82]
MSLKPCVKCTKDIIRGAVIDGHNWIFLVLKIHSSGDGAIYAQSLQRTRLMSVVLLVTKKFHAQCVM